MSTQKSEVKIMPRAIVCEDTNLRGDITISGGCVIHPSATIVAESGPIIIGENCIVEEYVSIVHRVPPGQAVQSDRPPVLVIGANNVFEVGCRIEALKIGERNIFECHSSVSADVKISNGCVIGAGCHLTGAQDLPENTVITGKDCILREALEKQSTQTLQLDFLRKVLPNYHHIRKVTFDPKKIRTQV
ncbi:dynactin subunit 6 [Phlebotomus argentipes]|uniref:dynactin subunit 6 n=1 Tax=Phlebotomus argentipes TaxID=94469 RepID=UPI00289304C9|nr:dynactin subunit 6 [Phlebotomus argentipes]